MRQIRSCFNALLPAAVVFCLLAGCGSNATDPSPSDNSSQREAASGETAGFQQLTLADFTPFAPTAGAAESWSAENETLNTTGQPRGYLLSKESYGDFTLQLELRYQTPESDEDLPQLNTGVLLYVVGENRLWPVCLEVQGKYIELAQIKSNARDLKVEAETDIPARDAARKPPEEWNQLEITGRAGALTVKLNGEQVSQSQPAVRNGSPLTEGRIGLQSEGSPVTFRNIRIRTGSH